MNSTANLLLQVDCLRVDLGGRSVLRDVHVGLGRGECLGVIGPNGGGKTTFLRTLLGVYRPTSGSVRWAGPRSGAICRGYVPQHCDPDRTCPLSAREVVRQGAVGWGCLTGRRRRELGRRAEELLDEVGLGDDGGVRYVELSGGQQRRVLLARALVSDPSVLLLDEPTSGVDLEGREQFGALLRAIHARGVAIILVSHDLPWVARHADRIACLNGTLHWHGRAAELPPAVVEDLCGCEWPRFRAGLRDPELAAAGLAGRRG